MNTFPKYIDIQLPLAQEILLRGGETKPTDTDQYGRTVYDALADHFNLSDSQRKITIFENKKERPKWENMVRWARNDLRKKSFLTPDSPRGVWKLSEQGLAYVLTQKIEYEWLISGEKGIISPENFEKRQKAAAELGKAGEEWVLKYEYDRLTKLGHTQLASKVKIISTYNVAAGYDISSFSSDGSPLYIEVKTTKTANPWNFELTHNELEFAKHNRQRQKIYRVYNFNTENPKINIIDNIYERIQNETLHLKARSWLINQSDKKL
jgi:hypothetical protein